MSLNNETESDPFQLQRFIDAQDPVIDTVVAELRVGRKRSHWMWFVFPQFAGLGTSSMARHFAIASDEEARAYLSHPVLGSRLINCCQLLLASGGASANDILGPVDALKLRSSMTLFSSVSEERVFNQVLQQFYNGEPDNATLTLLQSP